MSDIVSHAPALDKTLLYLGLLLGFALLVGGGELLVRGASALAARLGVSPLLVGLTVVGFGTSTPELVTSLQAALADSPGIAVGNVVGSNIANILLILGVAALIFPVAVERRAFRRDGVALVLATLAGTVVILGGSLARLGGAVLMAGLVAYIVAAYLSERQSPQADAAEQGPGLSPLTAGVLAVAGIALTILGARSLVSGATGIATQLGVSEAVIGLTVVAVGTSLPELVTAVVAALKREADIAFGNIVGSNIYNILGILGVTALVKPIEVPAQIANLDVWVMGAATLALVAVAISGWRVTRAEGVALLVAYAAYVGWLGLA